MAPIAIPALAPVESDVGTEDALKVVEEVVLAIFVEMQVKLFPKAPFLSCSLS